MTKYFEVTQGGIYYGKKLVTSGSASPGHLMALGTGGSVISQCGASGCPFGMLVGSRFVYAPTSTDYATGETAAVVLGDFMCLISAEYFSTGSIPTSVNTPLYAAAGGVLATSGTTQVGQFIRSKAVTLPGGSQSVALCRINLAAA